MIPGSQNKGLCPVCHKFFHPETGELVAELTHIVVESVTEKLLCRRCGTLESK
jgi:hypothetical protein